MAVALSALAQRPQDATADAVRGVWVPRTALVSRASIASVVRAAENAGFNTLLVQVRGRGEAFYRGASEPRATDLANQPADFDPLATVLTLARAAGLRVHAWININLVASGVNLPRSRDHVVWRHPEWLMIPRALAVSRTLPSAQSAADVRTLAAWTRKASETVEGLYLSPISDDSQTYTTAVVRDLVERYPLDGVHLDYIRYPGAAFDYGASTVAAFRAAVAPARPAAEQQQLDRAAVKNPVAWADGLPAEFAAFRRDRLTALVRRLQAAVRAARPQAIVSAAVVPDQAAARSSRMQDWSAWARAGYLDVACPMIYTPDATEFAALAAAVDSTLGELPFWAGIGAYRLSLPQTVAHVRTARRAGAAGVVVFSSDFITRASASDRAQLRTVLLEPTRRVLTLGDAHGGRGGRARGRGEEQLTPRAAWRRGPEAWGWGPTPSNK